MLLDLLQEPSLAELWRGQLGPAGGHAVGGHAAWVLADAAALAIQVRVPSLGAGVTRTGQCFFVMK